MLQELFAKLQQQLAKHLLVINHKTVAEGVSGILEKEIHQYRLLTSEHPKAMAVPPFVYNEFLASCKRRGVYNTETFAGVKLIVSENNRFEFPNTLEHLQ